MQVEQQEKVLRAFQLVLRPVVKILLRYGIGFNQFAETVKTAYVDVASSEFGIRGRPTNISRVAVMTGLTRKEVRRLRTKLESGEDNVKVKTTPITEVLYRWHSDPEFLDENDRPRVLEFSNGTPSFADLVKKHGGDIPPGAMRTELRRIGAIQESDDGALTATTRAIIPSDVCDGLVAALVHGVYPLLSTVSYNSDPDQVAENRFAQVAAHSVSIEKQDLPRLRRICHDRIHEAAVSFDDLFMSYEALEDGRSSSSSKRTPTVVGFYYFEEVDENVEYEW